MTRTPQQATEDRIAHLPEWAQRHIQNLGNKISGLETRLEAMRGDKSRTRIDNSSGDWTPEPDRYLNDFAEIEWRFGDDDDRMATISVRRERRERSGEDTKEWLVIMGGDRISILPCATNTCEIRVQTRKDTTR